MSPRHFFCFCAPCLLVFGSNAAADNLILIMRKLDSTFLQVVYSHLPTKPQSKNNEKIPWYRKWYQSTKTDNFAWKCMQLQIPRTTGKRGQDLKKKLTLDSIPLLRKRNP